MTGPPLPVGGNMGEGRLFMYLELAAVPA